MKEILHAFTDGACKKNPGKGGWGWIEYGDKDGQPDYKGGVQFCDYGGDEYTTNNKMEITAVIEYLKDLPYGKNAIIYSDSQYVLKSLVKDGTGSIGKTEATLYSGWMKGWKAKKFEEVKNADLWKKLDKLIAKHISRKTTIAFRYVKAHAGIIGNEKADRLANLGVPR